MLQLFIASFCDQTDIEGNGCNNMTKAKKLKQQALLKLKNENKSCQNQPKFYKILNQAYAI